MSARWRKFVLLLLAGAFLVGVSQVQNSMNRDRARLGLTQAQPLENAPPVLAFTTMALGGFRGLISNLLWMRANELQTHDKYFEMVQLADWITKLEPHFAQVWIFEEWNMAWNISVKFKDYADRWRWVQRGIELLRDQALRYNPDTPSLYRELAWIFQNKIGANTDDASLYYKQQWANDMAKVFGDKTPNLEELIDPKTPDEKKRAALLRDTYKMDPRLMKKVNEEYGPLEWRLPEATAIYWAVLGLERAKLDPARVKKSDLISLHRVIYQSLLETFERGRLEANPYARSFDFAPNLDVIPKLNFAYEQALKEDPTYRDNILQAQRNFLRQAVYFLYEDGRVAEAAKWYKYLGDKFPNKPILDSDPTSFPRTLSLDQYAVACAEEDINDTSRDDVKSAIQGLLRRAYFNLVLDRDGRFEGLRLLAQKVWAVYESKIPRERQQAMGLPPFAQINQEVLAQLLDPKHGMVPEAQAVLRTKLRLPAGALPPVPPPASTNAPPAAATTRALQ